MLPLHSVAAFSKVRNVNSDAARRRGPVAGVPVMTGEGGVLATDGSATDGHGEAAQQTVAQCGLTASRASRSAWGHCRVGEKLEPENLQNAQAQDRRKCPRKILDTSSRPPSRFDRHQEASEGDRAGRRLSESSQVGTVGKPVDGLSRLPQPVAG
jgi:hypothetical protein